MSNWLCHNDMVVYTNGFLLFWPVPLLLQKAAGTGAAIPARLFSRVAARVYIYIKLYIERDGEPIDTPATGSRRKTNWSVYRKSLLYCIRLKGVVHYGDRLILIRFYGIARPRKCTTEKKASRLFVQRNSAIHLADNGMTDLSTRDV